MPCSVPGHEQYPSQEVGPVLLHSLKPPENRPSRDVTLLFSDVAGSTELTERLGDLEAHRVIRRHHRVVQRVDGECPFGFDDGRDVQLKGFSRNHRVFRLAWGSGHGEADSALASPEGYLPAVALAAP